MGRAFHIPGIFLLFCAFVLLLLVSISLPYMPVFSLVRTTVQNGTVSTSLGETDITQLRLGIWASCIYEPSGERVCSAAELGYSPTVYSNASSPSSFTLKKTWTQGLALHPVAAGVTLISFMFSLFRQSTFTLLTFLTAFLASLAALAAFATDIALLVYFRNQITAFNEVTTSTDPAPAFWMTFASFLALCFASCSVYLGRRRDRMDDSKTYPVLTSKRASSTAPPRSWKARFWKRP